MPTNYGWKKAHTFHEILPFLTTKQKNFVLSYAENATQACKDAGYKGNDNLLGVQGYRLLRQPKIQKALELRNNGRGNGKHRAIMDREELQATWSEIARGWLEDKQISTSDRLKAMDSLAKSQGLFLDRVEVKGAIANLTVTELKQMLVLKGKALGITIDTSVLPDIPDV